MWYTISDFLNRSAINYFHQPPIGQVIILLLSSAKRLREFAIDPSPNIHSSAFSVHIPRPIPISSQHTDINSHANQFNPALIYPSIHLPCGQTGTDYLPTNDSQQQVLMLSYLSLLICMYIFLFFMLVLSVCFLFH